MKTIPSGETAITAPPGPRESPRAPVYGSITETQARVRETAALSVSRIGSLIELKQPATSPTLHEALLSQDTDRTVLITGSLSNVSAKGQFSQQGERPSLAGQTKRRVDSFAKHVVSASCWNSSPGR